MDRDKRWERVKLAYDAIVHGDGAVRRRRRGAVIEAAYAEERHRRVHPAGTRSSTPTGSRSARWRDGDSVIFFNFRADRARQIIRALVFEDFDGFDRTRGGAWPTVALTTLTEYDATYPFPIAFPPQRRRRSTSAKCCRRTG